MAKHHASAQNAVTHGIFRRHDRVDRFSAFAALAVQAVPGPFGEDMATDLVRAEEHVARCRASILEQAGVIEAVLAASPLFGDDPFAQIDDALRHLNRLLRYQNSGLIALRKARIVVLNTAEGLDDRCRDPRG